MFGLLKFSISAFKLGIGISWDPAVFLIPNIVKMPRVCIASKNLLILIVASLIFFLDNKEWIYFTSCVCF